MQVLIFSFFKAYLDLTEAMLASSGVHCWRFDGDAKHAESMKALQSFKDWKPPADGAGSSGGGGSSPRCCLLATVHSGGVGLNIVEASTVIFCDRWLNPTVSRITSPSPSFRTWRPTISPTATTLTLTLSQAPFSPGTLSGRRPDPSDWSKEACPSQLIYLDAHDTFDCWAKVLAPRTFGADEMR